MAAATLAASALLTICWLFTPATRQLVMLTAFVPFALLGYALAAVGWWAVRRLGTSGSRRVSTTALALSVVGVVLHAALLVPSYAGAHATGSADLTVMTANLRLGHAEPAALRRLVARSGADVVVLEEATSTLLEAVDGLRESHPYTAGTGAPGAFGTVVFSRWPLQEVTQLPVSKGAWQMRVAAPHPFWLVAAHTSQPLVDYPRWKADHAALHAALARLRGAVVAAGDFNATLDHRPMRDLLGLGYADAAREANAGWQPTWPGSPDAAGALPLGMSVLTLDHVLLSTQLSAVSTSTYRLARSDHRALVARIAVR